MKIRQLLTIGIGIFVGGIVWPLGWKMLDRGFPELSTQQLYLWLGVAILLIGTLTLLAVAGWIKFSWEEEKNRKLEEASKVRPKRVKNHFEPN